MSLLYASRMMEYRQDGYQEGIYQGTLQTKLETARNLLAEGLAPAMVARCTGLPLETIQQLEVSS